MRIDIYTFNSDPDEPKLIASNIYDLIHDGVGKNGQVYVFDSQSTFDMNDKSGEVKTVMVFEEMDLYTDNYKKIGSKGKLGIKNEVTAESPKDKLFNRVMFLLKHNEELREKLEAEKLKNYNLKRKNKKLELRNIDDINAKVNKSISLLEDIKEAL